MAEPTCWAEAVTGTNMCEHVWGKDGGERLNYLSLCYASYIFHLCFEDFFTFISFLLVCTNVKLLRQSPFLLVCTDVKLLRQSFYDRVICMSSSFLQNSNRCKLHAVWTFDMARVMSTSQFLHCCWQKRNSVLISLCQEKKFQFVIVSNWLWIKIPIFLRIVQKLYIVVMSTGLHSKSWMLELYANVVYRCHVSVFVKTGLHSKSWMLELYEGKQRTVSS